MSTARVIDCVALANLRQALHDVSEDTTICIVQSVSSFLAAAPDTGSIFGTIDPILADFSREVKDLCSRRQALVVLVAPPMFRIQPAWYRQHLPQIAQQFSTVLSASPPKNLHLLSSAVTQSLGADGVHLDPVAGLHYVLHLFDDAERVVKESTTKGEYASYFILFWLTLLVHHFGALYFD